MAGDWIKMRKSLPTDGRIVRMMSALNADRLRTLGGLMSAWCLLDEHTSDGKLQGYTPAAFDEIIGFPGLAHAMEAVGWLEVGDGFLQAPDFERHNGTTAKRRAQESVRKMSARNADKCPQVKQTKSAPEKRREEKNIISLSGNDNGDPESVTLPEDAPAEAVAAWAEWQAYRQSRAAAKGTLKYPWTEQAARMGANQMMAYIGTHGIRAVCDRVASAISSNWKGINLDSMEASKLASAAPIENQYGPLQPDKWKLKA